MNDLTIHTEVFSSAHATCSIVFLHGGGVSSWMWNEHIQSLQDYHCLLVDLPGHGKNFSLPFEIRSSAEEVLKVIESKAIGGRAYVVGLSLGAQVALEMLSIKPSAILGSFLSGLLIGPVRGTRLLPPLLKGYSIIKNRETMIQANRKWLEIPIKYHKQFSDETRLHTSTSLSTIMIENMRFSLPSNLDKSNTPCYLVYGEKESRLIKKSAEKLLTIMPQVTGLIVKKGHHNWCLAHPSLLVDLLLAMIKGETPENEHIEVIKSKRY